MKSNNKRPNFIIIIIIILLVLLVIVMQTLVTALKKEETENNIQISLGNRNEEQTTVQKIIEDAGSKYIDMTEKIFIKIYVDFKYDLYDENGKSKEDYFMDIIEQIVDLKKDTFYLIDEEKNIEIYVNYDKEKDKYTVKINSLEDFYDETDGESYFGIYKSEIVKESLFGITNTLYGTLRMKDMYFSNTVIVTGEREKLPNGYYTYPQEHIKAKLGGGKVLNLIFDKEYEGQITSKVNVTTKLEDVEKIHPKPSSGSSREGYLCYRTTDTYTFLYGDEISIYPYKYQPNSYFDQYLSDYCASGDLDKLVSDFTTEWSSYFEFEYDAENQNLKLVFPTRGISIDIQGNDSKGITIYNNYYLTDTVKELIKNNKISIEPEKDLIFITEQNRRESMK